MLLAAPLLRATEEGPDPEDVTAGWTAFAIFGLLILALVILGMSLVKRLRNVDRAEVEGRYGGTPQTPPADPSDDAPDGK